MKFKNITAFVAFILVASFGLNAQDQVKSAASLYNDGLALLKEKNYVEGLPIMEESLAKGSAEGNEKVIYPRLADAEFFYEQDKKKTLSLMVEDLKPASSPFVSLISE